MSTKTIKTAEATDAALDWLVAKCENAAWEAYDKAMYAEADPMPARPSEFLRDHEFGPEFTPSTDWAQGGPIIERERIKTDPRKGTWEATIWNEARMQNPAHGPTVLIAAMRCLVASKLGPEVEVPEELIAGSEA